MAWYSIRDLALICQTSEACVLEAATIMGKKPLAGQLVFRPCPPLDFILEIRRIDAMHRRQAQRRKDSSHAGNEHRSAIAARVQAAGLSSPRADMT